MKKTKTKKRVAKNAKVKRGTRLKKGWKLFQGIPEAQWAPKALKEFMKSERPPLKFNFVKTSIPRDKERSIYTIPLIKKLTSKVVGGTICVNEETLDRDEAQVSLPPGMTMEDFLKQYGQRGIVEAVTRGELGKAPAHYSNGKYTPWEIVDDWNLEYYCGNALKYVCRHKHKGTPEQDIQKAIDCLIKYKAILSKETK